MSTPRILRALPRALLRALPALFAPALLAACMSGGGTTPVTCEGTTTAVEGESFCVYDDADPSNPCPDDLPFRYEREGRAICAADDMVAEETLSAAIGSGPMPVLCEGTTTTVEGDRFCVYSDLEPSNPCPDDLPFRYEHEGHTVCAAAEELSAEVLDAAIGGGSAGPTGERCGDGIVVSALPFMYDDALISRSLDDPYDGMSCGIGTGVDRGGDYRDVVFEFTPTVTGDYRWTIQSIEQHGGFMVTTDCNGIASTCEGGFIVDAFEGGGNRVFPLNAGTTYFGILMAAPAVDFSTHPGGYRFLLEQI